MPIQENIAKDCIYIFLHSVAYYNSNKWTTNKCCGYKSYINKIHITDDLRTKFIARSYHYDNKSSIMII